jgi:autotransporter-associated beta strand protein
MVQINGGTIKAGSTSALGGTGVTVANGGTLDLFGRALGVPVVVSGMGAGGNGAIVNSGAVLEGTPNAAGNGLVDVTLVGDTALGGPGSWDTDPVKNLGVWGITGSLNTGSTNFNLIKVGLNQVSLSGGVVVDPALGNIDVQAGMFALQGSVSSLGDPGSNITVHAGATVSFFDTTTPWDKKFVLTGDGVTPNLFNYDGANTIVGSVNLNGNCVIGAAPAARGTPIQLSLNGPVIGTGSLIKPSQDTLSLSGTNTYSGTTTVSGGTLSVDGVNRGAGMITVSAGGTLGGIGIIHSPVTIAAGGALAPGNTNTPMATLSISNTLVLAGTTTMDLNKSGTTLTSDLITNISTLSLGGTLQLNATGDALAAGDAFKIFSFAAANGAIAAFDPPTPGDGLMWDTSTLKTDGKIRVSVAQASRPGIGSILLSGGKVILTGTNGSASGNYYVLSSTNVALPLSSWTSIGTDVFNNGNFGFTNSIDPSAKQEFYIIQQAP